MRPTILTVFFVFMMSCGIDAAALDSPTGRQSSSLTAQRNAPSSTTVGDSSHPTIPPAAACAENDEPAPGASQTAHDEKMPCKLPGDGPGVYSGEQQCIYMTIQCINHQTGSAYTAVGLPGNCTECKAKSESTNPPEGGGAAGATKISL